MEATSFPEVNSVLSPPSSMTEDECRSLSVCRCKDSAGSDVVISAWKLVADEVEQVLRGEPLYLTVMGTSMPPVILSFKRPFA